MTSRKSSGSIRAERAVEPTLVFAECRLNTVRGRGSPSNQGNRVTQHESEPRCDDRCNQATVSGYNRWRYPAIASDTLTRNALAARTQAKARGYFAHSAKFGREGKYGPPDRLK